MASSVFQGLYDSVCELSSSLFVSSRGLFVCEEFFVLPSSIDMVHDEREYITIEEQTPARKAFRMEESLYDLFIVLIEISKVQWIIQAPS